MIKNVFYIKNCRFHLYDENVLFLCGSFRLDTMAGERLVATLDRQKLEIKVEEHDLPFSLMQQKGTLTKQYYAWVQLPDDWQQGSRLRIVQYGKDGKRLAGMYAVSRLKKMQMELAYKIEQVQMQDGQVIVKGWYAEPTHTEITLTSHGKYIPVEVKNEARPDVKAVIPEACLTDIKGFEAAACVDKADAWKLYLNAGNRHGMSRLHPDDSAVFGRLAKIERIAEKTSDSMHQYGIRGTYDKIQRKLLKKDQITYKNWRKLYTPDKKELQRQRDEYLEYQPKISVLVSAEESGGLLTDLIRSMLEQTYADWELCIAAAMDTKIELGTCADSRVRIIRMREQESLAEMLNGAVREASGDYMVLADAKDCLAPDALYECVKRLNQEPEAVILYTDEDKLDLGRRRYYAPQFKTDYNLDLLRSCNYISHLCLVRCDIAENAGYLDPSFDDALEYDYILRCTECADPKHIVHIPKVLYHVRNTADTNKADKYHAEKRALEAHLKRLGICAEVLPAEAKGCFRVKYSVKEKPLVSVIIPTKDHIEDLDKCLRSLEEINTYHNIEYIIVENNSEKAETFAYYEQLAEKMPRAKVVYWKEMGFNYPAINNTGVRHAGGDYLLFLNNDTEIVNADCIEEMLGQCQRKEVGAVGARLYYEDGTIQHAGVIVGLGGVAGHAFVGYEHDDPGYCGRIMLTQDYSAVTAACMMVDRRVFEEAGGFDEQYAVAFNDVDLCLAIRKAGYLIVYDPYAELKHYESKSRGMEDTDEKVRRFNLEIALFQERWKEVLETGDPYYSPNLTLAKNDFSLAVDVR